MKEIVVLGAGEAGLHFIEKIREKDSSSKIILIDKNPYYFTRRELISSLCAKSGIEIRPWAEERNVEFIQSSVERINLKRRKIYFTGREALGFSILIVATGLLSQKAPIKGEHREGFFYLSRIDPIALKYFLKVSSEATVYVSTLLGLALALTLKSKGMEVTIVSSHLDFLSQDKERMVDFLKAENIPLYLDVSIDEAIGEGAIKAIKLSPLKVLSSQLLFVDSGFLPNRKCIEEELTIKDIFFTDFEGVYLLGDVNRQDIEEEFFFIFNQEEARKQASVFARFLLEGKFPIFQRKLSSPEDKQNAIEGILKSRDCSDEGMRLQRLE